MADALLEHGEHFPALLYHALADQLRTDGMDALNASRVALRGCQLAVMLLDGVEQRAAAVALDVSERTAKYDAQRLRRVVQSGVLIAPRIGRLPPVPRRPGDRVKAPPSTRQRRRRG